MASSSDAMELKWLVPTPAFEHIKDIPMTTDDSNTYYGSTKTKRQRLECSHCYREVTFLIYKNACTYECALAIASRYSQAYDCVYSSIERECDRYHANLRPLRAPKPSDDTTPEEYWENISQELYGKDPIMFNFLQERLQENAIENPLHGSTPTTRCRTN